MRRPPCTFGVVDHGYCISGTVGVAKGDLSVQAVVKRRIHVYRTARVKDMPHGSFGTGFLIARSRALLCHSHDTLGLYPGGAVSIRYGTLNVACIRPSGAVYK